MNRYIVVSEEAGPSKPERDPEPASPSNIDRGQPRKCPKCGETHHGSSQLGVYCCTCEYDKIESGELDLPKNPQYSEERETW